MRAFPKTKRRGRPRNVVATGPDRGTPEQMSRRFKLVGDGPQELASYPLGVLFARKIITQEQHNAGLDYSRLHRAVIGKHQRSAGGDPIPDDVLEGMQRRFDVMRAALKSSGRRSKDAVDNAAVYDRFPGWLFRKTIRDGDSKQADALCQGLHALERAFGERTAA
tara:strand:- start:325 stop:819 length:495 start_codon:yes stop_codon:yes gene_type:complete